MKLVIQNWCKYDNQSWQSSNFLKLISKPLCGSPQWFHKFLMNVIFNSKFSQTIQSNRTIPIHFGKKNQTRLVLQNLGLGIHDTLWWFLKIFFYYYFAFQSVNRVVATGGGVVRGGWSTLKVPRSP